MKYAARTPDGLVLKVVGLRFYLFSDSLERIGLYTLF